MIWIVLIYMLASTEANYTESNNKTKTPLTLCCKDDQFYRPGLDRCLYRTHDPEPGWNSLAVLYAVGDNDTNLVGQDEFQVSYNLAPCPEGLVASSTTEFQVFVDGKLLAMESVLNPGEFCISQSPTWDPSDPVFVARYCVPDPCIRAKCLRKCCPLGFAVDVDSHSCQPNEAEFNVTELRKENGGPIENERSLSLHSGLGFKCRDEDVIQVDDFIIFSDGLLSDKYVGVDQPDDRPTDQYCIDHFVEGETNKLMGLKCLPAPVPVMEDKIRASIIHPYLLFGSALFLLAAFVFYVTLPALRTKTGISVMSFVFSMAVYYIGLGLIQMMPTLSRVPKEICVSLPVLIHFACLATFCWLNVLCFDLWWSLRMQKIEDPDKVQSNRALFYYSIYGWGVPFVIVTVGQVLEHLQVLPDYIITPSFDQSRCWFSNTKKTSLFAYLYGPVTIMFVGNLFFFIMTAVTMCKSKENQSTKRPDLGVRSILVLYLLMGSVWIMECITILVKESLLTWLLTDIVHILTGFFIFIVLVCNQTVWNAIKKKFHCCASGQQNTLEPHSYVKRSTPYLGNNEHRFMPYDSQRIRQSRIVDELTDTLPARQKANKEKAKHSASRLDNILKSPNNLIDSSSYKGQAKKENVAKFLDKTL